MVLFDVDLNCNVVDFLNNFFRCKFKFFKVLLVLDFDFIDVFFNKCILFLEIFWLLFCIIICICVVVFLIIDMLILLFCFWFVNVCLMVFLIKIWIKNGGISILWYLFLILILILNFFG